MLDRHQHDILIAGARDKWKRIRAAQVATYASLPKMKNICWVPKRDRWMVKYRGAQDFTSLTPEGAKAVLETMKIRDIKRQLKQLTAELQILEESSNERKAKLNQLIKEHPQ